MALGRGSVEAGRGQRVADCIGSDYMGWDAVDAEEEGIAVARIGSEGGRCHSAAVGASSVVASGTVSVSGTPLVLDLVVVGLGAGHSWVVQRRKGVQSSCCSEAGLAAALVGSWAEFPCAVASARVAAWQLLCD